MKYCNSGIFVVNLFQFDIYEYPLMVEKGCVYAHPQGGRLVREDVVRDYLSGVGGVCTVYYEVGKGYDHG
jgi:hypothetical protein